MEKKWGCCFLLCCSLSHVGVALGKEGSLRIDPSYNPFFVQLGAPLSITCVKDVTCAEDVTCVKDGVGPRSVLWSVNGDPPETWGFRTQRWIQTLASGTVRSFSHLTKDMVSLGDIVPGGLLCHTDVTGEEMEEVFVSVNFFNVLLESPNITEGDDVSLKCAPDTVAKITWSRDGQVIDDSTDRRLLQDGNRTLVLLDSRPRDSGVYQCRVMVKAGFDLQSKAAKVQTFIQNISVAGRPYLTEPVTSRVTTQLNGSLTLRCPVHGHPIPQVFWLHPGDRPLPSSPRLSYASSNDITDAVLTISGVTRSDLGSYYCVAKNGIGQLSTEFHVGVVSGTLSTQTFRGQTCGLIGLSVVMVVSSLKRDVCHWL